MIRPGLVRERLRRVLVVEDDAAQLRTLTDILRDEGLEVHGCATGIAALHEVAGRQFGVAILDQRLPDLDGVGLLEEIHTIDDRIRVIIHTAYGSFSSAKASVNSGAFAYVEKLGNPAELVRHVQRALTDQAQQLTAELESTIAEQTQALHESESRLRAIIGAAVDAIIVTDDHGVIETFNPAAARLFGHAASEVVGQDVAVLFGEADAGSWVLGPGREVQARRKDGNTFPAELTLGGMTVGPRFIRVAILRDLTEKHQVETRLRQAQKMQALGTLAGGIAHEFNNLLTSIQGFSELTLQHLPASSQEAGNLRIVLQAADRAALLIKQILAFSGQRRTERQQVPVAPLVSGVLVLLRPSMPPTVDLRAELDSRAGDVVADPTLLQQVVANLCDNAIQAMRSQGGVLLVAVSAVEIPGDAVLSPGLAPGQYVRLRVSDTGHGMTPEVQKRIFEPFFTTRTPGEGSGLGLSAVHGIVEDLGGTVTLTSQVGAGTTFDVFLPRATEETPAETGSADSNSGATRLRILLVDDDAAVRRFAQAALERLGHEVDPVEGGVEALERFRQDPARYDLVISDQNMPGLTGLALAERISAIRAGTAILLVTGYSEQMSEESLRALGVYGVLYKPFRLDQLAEAIQRIQCRPEE